MRLLAETLAMLRLYGVHERGQFQFALFNSAVMPATLGYLGVMLFPEAPARLRWWMAGAVAFGLGMGGLAQVGFAVLSDRFLGRLDLLRSAPVAKGAYYAAQVGLAVIQAVALVLAALAVLRVLGLVGLGLGDIGTAILVAICAGSAIGGLGAVLASRARDFDEGNTIIAVAALGLALVSPVFYELSELPRGLQPVALLSPFTHIAPLLRALLENEPLPRAALAGTLGMAGVLNALSYRWVVWQE